MASKKKAARKPRFASPQDAINAICSDVTSQVDRLLRAQSGVRVVPSIEGASYIVEAGGGAREFAFGTSTCSLSSSKGKLSLRFTFKHRKPGGRAWKARTAKFPIETETTEIVYRIVSSMGELLRKR